MPIGVSVLDLLPQPVPPGAQTVVPAGFRAFLEQFAAVNLTSSTTGSSTAGGATFHYGTLTPIAEVFDVEDAARGWFVQGAGFNRGVRFQLALTRQALGAGQNTEPQPASFQLDLFLEQVSIFVPFLKAAKLIAGDGTTPAHLEPDPSSPEVRIVGNAILRFTNAAGSFAMALVDFPDPFAPAPFSVTGAVASMAFSPPHFFVASSAIGMTVRRLTFDASQGYTPIDIVARNQGPDWTGLAINEALLYLPRNTPLVGNLVLGVRDVLLGDPFGMQGELHVEWGTPSIDATTVEVWQATGTNAGDPFEKVTLSAVPGELDRTIVFDEDRPLRFFAQVTTTDAVVRWILPDGSAAEGIVTPEFRARAGDTLICVRSETATDGTVIELPEIRHHFTAPGGVAPQIRLSLNGNTYDNVVNVSGSPDALGAVPLVFSANPTPADADQLVWQLGDGPTAIQEQGGTFDLPIATRLQESGVADLVLSDSVGRQRRVRLETVTDASFLIGDEDGVFDTSQQPLAVQAIERTAILDAFHDDGSAQAASPAQPLEISPSRFCTSRGIILGASAATRRAAFARSRQMAKTATKPKGTGMAVHIGLNAVDPAHYEGWSGPLNACEADANDMTAISKAFKIKATTLLTAQGTRAKVLGAIRDAAKKLKKGDFFLLTYSGHGGQVADVTGEEDDKQDETWCLFDGQLIDDELYLELSRFASGVRIFVLSDSCHSGTVTRDRPVPPPPGTRSKMMPPDIARKTYAAHKDFYDGLQKSVSKAASKLPDPDTMLSHVTVDPRVVKLAGKFKPAVVLISGCQDNQTSLDGEHNGAFTEQLLKVWDTGAFKGTYKTFHAQIKSGLPSSQTPNLFALGAATAFLKQQPFTV